MGQIDWAFFQTIKLKSITAIPMIDSRRVGVKLPVSGTGAGEEVEVALEVVVGVADDVGDGVVV